PCQIFFESERIQNRIETIVKEYEVLFDQEKENRICLNPEVFLTGLNDVKNKSHSVVYADEWIDPSHREDEIFSLPLKKAEGFAGRSREVRKGVKDLLKQKAKICISSPYEAQLKRIAGIFSDEDFHIQVSDSAKAIGPPLLDKKSSVYLFPSNLREGFIISDLDFYFWTDADIFGRSYRRRNRFKASRSSAIESFLDLKEKDFVVHVHHGVGRFVGLERVIAAGRERDFLVLEYRDEDRLYVPLDQISLVQKYVSSTESPSLDSLGKASFKKIKERVQQRVEEFAEELMRLYAVRISQKGFSYPPDTIWQDEFESDFPFDETPDQIQAIEAMKRDMESEIPMDRLVCGDVGYGKTEVAIRGAFKAVMAGRQAALVCPTTILALQHYRSFSERFKNYPIRVDWISRFRTRKETTQIKKDLRKGEIDIIIGTHALLSKDVYIKNLGLLIVDEEQRFGVVHKESIKNMRKLIDVMTLSATPIPRTLHMSLVGIRDLSIIQTPPRDRLPVRTYVMEDSDAIVVEGISRELERGGQVFFLHNRIETIDAAAERIRGLMPGVSISVLHGRMEEDEIEDILMDFMEKRFSVLVTTAIIESGIDMPNVNTLMIDRADTFGLSQLYQIRGRVGRSNRQAYAYLFYPDGKSLSELAQKRLNTIMEYQDLGSGFKVAMRDLEIRGAGNVLGKEQSGDIIEVGYELYVKLLEDAVRKLKGEDIDPDIRCSINLKTDFYISDEYITDVRQRIEFYKRLESSATDGEVDLIAAEMKDRFGEMPDSAAIFIQVEKIRALASFAGFESVFQEDSGNIQFKAGDYFRVPPEHLIQVLQKNLGLHVNPGKKDTLFYTQSAELKEEDLEKIIQILKIMIQPVLEKKKVKEAS
ncbi:MAG: transcription-repair coupling factor, partial [Spirochaetia bacterium]|nr:transcription-repair coupling factor [Spirochaetia bacterium]